VSLPGPMLSSVLNGAVGRKQWSYNHPPPLAIIHYCFFFPTCRSFSLWWALPYQFPLNVFIKLRNVEYTAAHQISNVGVQWEWPGSSCLWIAHALLAQSRTLSQE
jgi:hypothetical protein